MAFLVLGLLLLTSLGLGHLFTFWFQVFSEKIGITTFAGFFLISFFLFFLNVLGKFSLTCSSFIVLILSLMGLCLFLYQEKNVLKTRLIHPLFLLSLPMLISFIYFGNIHYVAYSSDEFSHWLTMPKQMYLHQELISKLFRVTEFVSYLPGWPSLLIYPSLILSSYVMVQYTLLISFFMSAVFLAALYDFLSGEKLETIKTNAQVVRLKKIILTDG